jgi:anti-anti-sigma factor
MEDARRQHVANVWQQSASIVASSRLLLDEAAATVAVSQQLIGDPVGRADGRRRPDRAPAAAEAVPPGTDRRCDRPGDTASALGLSAARRRQPGGAHLVRVARLVGLSTPTGHGEPDAAALTLSSTFLTPDVARLHVAGEIDMATSGQLDQAIHRALSVPRLKRLIIAMAEVTFLGVAGIRALITGHDRAAEHGVMLRVSEPRGMARRVLVLTGELDRLVADS